MSARAVALAITCLLGFAAFGQHLTEQTITRTYPTRAATARDLAEFAGVIRTMSDIRQVSTNTTENTLTLRGTAGQVSLAEWLITELDDSHAPASPSQQIQGSPGREYRVPDADDSVVRIFRLSNLATSQDLTELATLIRVMSDIRRLFCFNAPKAVVARGTADQIDLAEWLIAELDGAGSRPRGAQETQASSRREYPFPAPGAERVRLFRLTRTTTPQDVLAIATTLRTTAEARRIFIYNGRTTLAVRGTPAELALSEWLIAELDGTGPESRLAQQGPVAHEYQAPELGPEVVRVIYPKHATAENDLRDIGILIRDMADIRKSFILKGPKALAIRGTGGQLAVAEQLIRERDQPRPGEIVR